MHLTPRRQALIDAHVAETRRLMADYAFELNDLVRFALSAARDKSAGKVYYPMDPVMEGIRQWDGLSRKLGKLMGEVERARARLGVPPFEAEAPDADAPP